MRIALHGLALLCVMCLSGCHRAVGIEVNELANGRISIEARSGVIERVLGGRICLYGVTISQRQRGEHWTPSDDVWVIRQQRQDVCRRNFTFPDVPEGFELVVGDGVQLRSDVEYEVNADGPGILAFDNFVKR